MNQISKSPNLFKEIRKLSSQFQDTSLLPDILTESRRIAVEERVHRLQVRKSDLTVITNKLQDLNSTISFAGQENQSEFMDLRNQRNRTRPVSPLNINKFVL